MDKKAYFKRIGMDENTNTECTYEFLKKLHYQHVITIPYENLDILQGKPISLSVDALYDKIIRRNRGGYCFEVNGLFSALLKELGFSVTNYLGRFLRGEESIPVRRHRLLAVSCENAVYICDVSIGQSAPRYPLKLQSGIIQNQFGESYRFEKEDFYGWVLYDYHKGSWRKFYSFTEEPQLDIDFVQPSFYCEKHPESIFNKVAMLGIKTPDGRKTINDREYKIFRGNELVFLEKDLSDDRLRNLEKTEFGIEI